MLSLHRAIGIVNNPLRPSPITLRRDIACGLDRILQLSARKYWSPAEMLTNSHKACVSDAISPAQADRERLRRLNSDLAAPSVRICNSLSTGQLVSSAHMPAGSSMPNGMRERRTNTVGRAATASVPRATIGGLRLAVLDREQTADFMVEAVYPNRRVNRPLYLTSANGEVLSRCSTEPMTDRLFRAADLINADGQPLVMVSRLRSSKPLPERVATTDLFHDVARKAEELGLTFYLFGANEAENKAAIANVRRAYPALKIVGHSHGYLRGDALRAKVDEINALAPDFLWVALGVPYEQAFVDEYMPRLGNVGVIKTSGGLFNFLSGSRPRAPRWMQIVGLEWAWRLWLEPRRLFWRYLTTNPHALYLLFNPTRSSSTKD
ncbi:N-acetylglucosaminyldiphosphoundecaprenol N-acetyl-beta-D-mannosaminyltransferase [Bradyrhizobium sp. i1.8.4]